VVVQIPVVLVVAAAAAGVVMVQWDPEEEVVLLICLVSWLVIMPAIQETREMPLMHLVEASVEMQIHLLDRIIQDHQILCPQLPVELRVILATVVE
jgi:hypothetical protein